MPAWKWILIKYSTKAHFMRAIASLILIVAAYEMISTGKIADAWVGLVGAVVGYYFKGGEDAKDSHNPDCDEGADISTALQEKKQQAKP